MEVIVHIPQSKEAQEELNNVVAKVHADLAIFFIKNLPCSIIQKSALLKLVCEDAPLR